MDNFSKNLKCSVFTVYSVVSSINAVKFTSITASWSGF